MDDEFTPQGRVKGQSRRYLARFEGLVDIVENRGQPEYLVKDGGELKLLFSWERDGVMYIPPPKEMLPWLLPRWSEVEKAYQHDVAASLFRDLLAYHQQISLLPSAEHYFLIVTWDFSTYVIRQLPCSGYVLFYSVPERGKSKTGKGMIYVSHRGIHTETLNEASLFRHAQDRGATLFIDVEDLWKKAERRGSTDILLQRCERGAKVSRVIYPDKGPFSDTVFYDIYGATIIATNEPIHRVLDTRCFPISMPEASRNYPAVEPDQGLGYRERLVAWRAHMMGKQLPLAPQLTVGRLNDIAQPLWSIVEAVSPGHIGAYEKVITSMEKERLQEKSATPEATLIAAVDGLDHEVQAGRLAVSLITDELNRDVAEKWHTTDRSVGKRLRALGFEGISTTDGRARAIIHDAKLIATLKERYGLLTRTEDTSAHSEKTQETQETPDETKSDKADFDVFDISGVSAKGVRGTSLVSEALRRDPMECNCYRAGALKCAIPCSWAWPKGAKPGMLASWVGKE